MLLYGKGIVYLLKSDSMMSLKKNTLLNLAGGGFPLLLGLVAIPYLYRNLGAEQMGILTLVWALIGYFSLFDLGLGRALTQQVASSLAGGDEKRLPTLIKSGLFFTAGTGLCGGLLLAALTYPLAFKWLNVSNAFQSSVAFSLLIAALGIPLTTVTSGFRGVLEAFDDFRAVNFLRVLLGVSNFALPVVSVMLFGATLVPVICSLVLSRLIIFIAHAVLVDLKLPKKWHQTKFSIGELRKLFSFGVWMTVSNVISPLMVTADRFMISAVLGANVVAYYTVPSEMLTRLLILPLALTSALFPRLASEIVVDSLNATTLYRKSLKLIAWIMTPICVLIAIGSYWGLSLWLGKSFADHSWGIVAILAVAMLFNSIAQVPYANIQAAGRSRVTALIHIVELIFYLPILYLFMKQFGLIGAATASAIRVLFDLICLMFHSQKILNMKKHR